MKYALIGATATIALLGAATLASAQTQDDKGKGPSADGKAPAASQPQTEPKSQPRAGADQGKNQPKAAQQQQPPGSKATDGQQKTTQERSTDQPRSAQSPERDTKQKSAQQQPHQQQAQQQREKDGAKRSENPEPRADSQKTAEPQKSEPGQDRTRTTDSPKQDSDRQKTTRGKEESGRDQAKSADQPKQGERIRVTEQQRSTVRERLIKTRVEKTRINVNISVGAAIPRSVRLHTLPVAIVEVVPEYRGYRYIVLEDETIVIVHPTTYVIVDYIPASGPRADRPARTTHLALSSEQRRFVLQAVPKERTAEVRGRLVVGAEVPRDVELRVFPQDVTTRIPALNGYRYVVAAGEVMIVDPGQHEVVLVIDG